MKLISKARLVILGLLVAMFATNPKKHTFLSNTEANESGLAAILALIGAVVVAVVYFAIIPMVGSKIDAATTIESGSQWNTTENPDLPTGASLWGDTGSMIVVAFVIAAVSIVIWLLRTGI